MTIQITRFHKFEKGTLYGFLDIAVPLWGTMLNIKGCKVFNKDGKQWVNMPSREYQDDKGETKYQAIIGIDDEAVYKKFIAGVTTAWNEYCQSQAQVTQGQQPMQHEPVQEGVPF